MAQFIRGMINNHSYPSVYFTFNKLISLHHFVALATTLRNWYIKPAISGIIKNTGDNFILYDAGCGAGDFILPLMNKYKNSRFIGADKLPGNINLCNNYIKNKSLENGNFFQEDIENFILPEKADIVICITVLQYCNDDIAVLNNLFNSIKPGGSLLLYVPVNYERVFRWSEKLSGLTKNSDYDNNMGIRRRYTTNEIREKVISAGFNINSEITAYKTAGKISFELFSGFLNIIKGVHWFLAVLVFPLLVIFYPLIFFFMILDLFDPGKNGNGLLLNASRNS